MSTQSKKQKTDKLKIVKALVTAISNRQSKLHESCFSVCWEDKQRQKILKTVAGMDVKIDKIITDVRKTFSPKFDNYKNSAICLLLHIFASAFSSDVGRIVDSRDLDEICRGRAEEVLEIMDSLKTDGNLYQHISKVPMRRGNGFDFNVRSADLLWNYLIEDGGHAK